jgi:hypothetical protein
MAVSRPPLSRNVLNFRMITILKYRDQEASAVSRLISDTYKKTTGIRNFQGLKIQPMRKKLK